MPAPEDPELQDEEPEAAGTPELPPEEVREQEDEAERTYKRRIGVTLATLAVLAAFIAYVQTGASNEESSTAREATRLAAEAQTADVLSKGIQSGIEQTDAELALLPDRDVFAETELLASEFGVQIDPSRAEQRTAAAEETIENSLGEDRGLSARFSTEAERLSLEQKLTVEQRVTWNAKSSQYDTVLTVLAVAIFLLGFTLVVGRNLRPPLAVPGAILALVCAGWAGQIYLKPTPEVSQESIDATAEGRYLSSIGEYDAAIDEFDVALESTPDYADALTGRALNRVLGANPDFRQTLAWTDTSADVLDPAAADAQLAIDSGADEDATAWAVAAVVAVGQRDWDAAAEYLEEGLALNELAVELYLWRAAVAAAQGEPAEADEWLDRSREQLVELDEDRIRTLAAQYLTLLEYVAATEPEQAGTTADLTARGIASLAQARKGEPLTANVSPGATITAATASFQDDRTTLDIDVDGVEDGVQIVVAGYEDPGAGNGWVQSPELFYSGPAGEGREGGITLTTPRTCEPTRFRFDLYVEGEFRDSATATGGGATC